MTIKDLKASRYWAFECSACKKACLSTEAWGDIDNQVICEDCYNLYKRKPEVVIEALRKEINK